MKRLNTMPTPFELTFGSSPGIRPLLIPKNQTSAYLVSTTENCVHFDDKSVHHSSTLERKRLELRCMQIERTRSTSVLARRHNLTIP